MKTFPICSDIYYVGVNDRTKTLFENQLPLVCGVSYNSYLIVDEKVALIDTADSSCFEVYLKKIRAVLGDRKIDYLIVNHMEPDHSGSIALIRQYYPEITIVGNAKTFGMIEGFYGVTGNEMEIKEGSELSLGKHRLTFALIPMVHWPETMVTYDVTACVALFGRCFRLLRSSERGGGGFRYGGGALLGRDAPLLCLHCRQVWRASAESLAEGVGTQD
jgi:flavorubredoxin